MNDTRILKLPNSVTPTYLQNKPIEIPALCPRCGAVNNPTLNSEGYTNFSNGWVDYITCFCPACNQWSFIIVQEVDHEPSTAWKLLAQYPSNSIQTFDALINECSPRFVDTYNASYDAEQNGYYDLAGMGYRASLEILIKDWALQESSETKEQISKYQLNDVIAHFLKNDVAAFASSDVVRVFGNDFTHWSRPDEFDSQSNLDTLKVYLNIFINTILLKLQIAHPPVGRAHHSDSNSK
ncbi:DUF4145 domain-containing protein [Lactiplantibacillus plantarum]|uniref:DUF4145 domain-containing protein n=1 Tax=Lactiplantibacillus plantarum TaxID=1590 RepID=UPI0007093CF3|nr:DUF4145 domain-containing protein [Lactiplantibacillus plantarum]KRN36236.1 hypothetical protein IV39_GL000641 [Lactiplantibacillus plantarum]